MYILENLLAIIKQSEAKCSFMLPNSTLLTFYIILFLDASPIYFKCMYKFS